MVSSSSTASYLLRPANMTHSSISEEKEKKKKELLTSSVDGDVLEKTLNETVVSASYGAVLA